MPAEGGLGASSLTCTGEPGAEEGPVPASCARASWSSSLASWFAWSHSSNAAFSSRPRMFRNLESRPACAGGTREEGVSEGAREGGGCAG